MQVAVRGRLALPICLALLSASAVPSAPAAGREPETVVRASRTPVPPRLDGVLDDEAWIGAEIIDRFVQREPTTGQPSTQHTEVRVSFDSEAIYVAFRCLEDDPSRITAKELARDADLAQDDRVQVMFDTFVDGRNAYWFQIGPRGSIGDGLVSDNGERFNKQWDGLWDGRARIHDRGWDAELAIPLKTMRFRPGQTRWGLKLIRYIKHNEEIAYWPDGNVNAYRFQVSDSGFLDGLDGLTQGIGLDLVPYGLLGVNQFDGRSDEFIADAGIDAFYQVTSGLKAALTVNTDFAETEVDERRVNLTRFPLFFPEKRDFFLDGANYFAFGPARESLLPFFSRRMGLDEEGRPVPVLLGAKLTGQQGNWNLGLLNLVEDREAGKRNFTVARVSRNLGAQSAVGVISTHGNALGEAENSVLGADLRLATSKLGGDRNLSLNLYGLKSASPGSPNGQAAFGFNLLYPNDRWYLESGWEQIGEDFRAGLGFVPRPGIRQSSATAAFRPRPTRWGMRQLVFGAGMNYITDLDGRLLTRELVLHPLEVRWDSGDELRFRANVQHELLDHRFQVHPTYGIGPGSYGFADYRVALDTAQRRRIWLKSSLRWGEFFHGRRREAELSAGWKAAVPLFLGAGYQRNRIVLPEGEFTVNLSRLNANLLFSPQVTLYNFLQYDNLSRTLGWQSRFYWILRPGDEVIVVWNSSLREPLESLELTESTLRLKLNYVHRF